MKQLICKKTWNRKEHFEFFCSFDEPFFGITAPIDVTKAYQSAKDLEISFFVYYLHKTIATVNQIENFRYRIEENEVVLYDKIDASATIMRADGTFGFSFMEFHQDIHIFNKIVQSEINRIQTTTGLFTREFPQNIIHFSALPWVNFTGLTHSRSFSMQDSCPKISFGKLLQNENSKKMSVAIHVHHGLIDGFHVGQFLELLQKLLNE